MMLMSIMMKRKTYGSATEANVGGWLEDVEVARKILVDTQGLKVTSVTVNHNAILIFVKCAVDGWYGKTNWAHQLVCWLSTNL